MDGRKRFGSYLRALREARHLTLEDVERLTLEEPEPVTRSLLSRLENGKAKVSTLKLMALARLYGVRLGLLAERLEIDHELSLDDNEEVLELSPEQLLRRARQAAINGQIHRALYLYEQAEIAALTDGDDKLAHVRARLGTARAMLAAGRFRTARSVLEELAAEPLDEEGRAWTLYLLCRCYLGLEQHLLAKAVVGSLKELPDPVPPEIAALVPGVDAEVLAWEGRLDEALESWLSCLDQSRRTADDEGAVSAMIQLAAIQRRRSQYAEGLRWLDRARSRAEELGLTGHMVGILTEKGRIELLRGRAESARRAWSEARRIARRLRLHRELFDIYLELWRLAEREGQLGQIRACLRTLKQLARLLERVPLCAKDLTDRLGKDLRAPIAPLHAGG